MQAGHTSAKEVSVAPNKTSGATVTPGGVSGNLVGSVVSPGMATALELKNTSNINTKTTTTSVPQSCSVLSSEAWMPV